MTFISQLVVFLFALSSVTEASPSVKRFHKSQKRNIDAKATLLDGVTEIGQHRGSAWSNLGTLQAPKLPKFMGFGTNFPWGGRTAHDTNPYDDQPETGVTRYYDWTVTKQTISPDGVSVPGIVVNGQVPGPIIEANWGDWVEVKVTNNLGDEGTTMHWHGLLQKQSQWYDGVPAVDQCPIPPSEGTNTFTYRFKPDLYGTSWWHSHYSAQYSGGAAGPIVVYGPSSVDYDMDLGPVMMSDWYHRSYDSLIDEVMAPNNATRTPVSNNNLINGKNSYPCDKTTLPCTPNAGFSEFQFVSGKSMRLRLINSGAEAGQKFSIDNHNFSVIANDLVPIQPYTTDNILLGIGQRADIIVNGTGNPTDAVWMRAVACGTTDGISPEAIAAVYYQDAPKGVVPNTSNPAGETCGAPSLAAGGEIPAYPMAPGEPDTTINVDITQHSNGSHILWWMDESSFRGDYNSPTLLESKVGNLSFDPKLNVYNTGSNGSVRLIFYNHVVGGPPHPMHLHGHNLFVLATGQGTWDGHIEGDPNNPARRDVAMMPSARDPNIPAYIVTQWTQDNPGVWPYHCHIAWHISAGFLIQILERPDDVLNLDIPSNLGQTCRDWGSWTNTHIPDEIDSGL